MSVLNNPFEYEDSVSKSALMTPGMTSSVLLHSPAVVLAQASESDYEILVTNPQKQVENIAVSYIAYTVKSKKLRGAGAGEETSVFRRYSDFLWLHDLFHATHPNCVTPPVPEKSLPTSKFSPELLQYRSRELTRFIQRIAAHPLLATDPMFEVFLKAPWNELRDKRAASGVQSKDTDETTSSPAASQEAATPAGQSKIKSMASGMLSGLVHLGQSAGKAAGTALKDLPYAIGVSKEEDPDSWFPAKMEQVTRMEQALHMVMQASHILSMKLAEDLAPCFTTLATGSRTLGRVINQGNPHDSTAVTCAEISGACEHQVKLLEEWSRQWEHSYHDNIKDFAREIDSVRSVLEYRNMMVRRLTQATVAATKAKAKAATPPNELLELERQKDLAEQALADFSRIAKQDIERSEVVRQKEFQRVLDGMCNVSRDYSAQSGESWSSASSTKGAAPSSSSSSAAAAAAAKPAPIELPMTSTSPVAKAVSPVAPKEPSFVSPLSEEPAAPAPANMPLSSPYSIDD